MVRVVDLALECKKLEVFSHVSTAYTNSNMPDKSFVEEKINVDNCKDDWEVQIKDLLKMDRLEVEKRQKELIYGHANGYTYTKSLAERHIQRYASPKLRTVINRPSLIIHCAKEPFVGWTDTVSAVGTVVFPLSMGFIKNAYIPQGYRDIIPADYVSNAVVASTAYIGQQPGPCFQIYHNSSTVANPFNWNGFFETAAEYLKFNPSEKQLRDPVLRIYQDYDVCKR